MSKHSIVRGGIILTALIAAAACSPDNSSSDTVHGDSLKVDVVNPREPEPVTGGGPLSVGELANGYDHAEVMARSMPNENAGEDLGTSWDDDVWASDGSVAPTPDAGSDPQNKVTVEKEVRVTKVPSGF